MITAISNDMSVKIAEKAAAFTDVLGRVAMDDTFIVRASLELSELRPLKAGDIPAESFQFTSVSHDPAAFYSYEDAGMTTGTFLTSQSIRYKVTGDPEALRNADHAFAGIRHIYELGKTVAEGLFPKPYGNKISREISRDQYLFVLAGLKEYYGITGRDNQQLIKQMAQSMGHYWMNINYTHAYLGLPAGSHLTDFMGSLFLGIIRTAYEISKDASLLKEYQRLLHVEKLGDRMPETLRKQFLGGKKYDGGMYFRSHQHCMMMKTLAVDLLWDSDPENRPLWMKSLTAFWEDDLFVGFDPEDGLCYFIVGFDPVKNETFLTDPGVIAELENPLHIAHLTWGGRHKTALSTQLAYCAVVIADRLGDQQAGTIARTILEKVNLASCRELTAADPKDLPPGEGHRAKLLNVYALCAWLWTYWSGRQRKLPLHAPQE